LVFVLIFYTDTTDSAAPHSPSVKTAAIGQM
jgi:hypothetical protein